VDSLDNIKFDRETNSIHGGGATYRFGNLNDIMDYKNPKKKGASSLIEYQRDPTTKTWEFKRNAVVNKFGPISNSNRLGDYLVGGSFCMKGIVVCKIIPTIKFQESSIIY